MLKYLKSQLVRKKDELAKLNAKMTNLNDKVRNATTADEVRSLTDEKIALNEEISDKEKDIAETESQIAEAENTPAPATEPEGRGFNPMATYGMNAPKTQARSVDDDPTSTDEYRSAFKNYVQTGTMAEPLQLRNNKTMEITHFRADNPNVLADVGVLLPNTLVQQIMKDVEKVYGQLYSKVKKLNIAGGVEFPIGSFSAVFHRKGEKDSPTERQNAGKVTGSIKFTYHIGEIRISQTLLSKTISVPVFEAELAKVIVEAYVQAMDNEILNGSGTGEMTGILTEMKKSDSRIKAENIIEFTEAEMLDWKSWQTKLFAKIPLSMRKLKPSFVMTANTYEANIKTLTDDNNRPLWNETYHPVDGAEVASFKGKVIDFVEDGFGIENFNDAEDGEVFGLYWIPENAYAVNVNLQFSVRKYYDEEKDEYVTKALVINDGKVLDPKYLYILKKKVSA
jgi:HK97 family phage major capsid protein